MTKFKSNRDYTISLEIEGVGIFYYTSTNNSYRDSWSSIITGTTYQFKQNLKKVKTWKQRKSAEEYLDNLLKSLTTPKTKIGVEIPKEILPDEYKSLTYKFKNNTFIRIEKPSTIREKETLNKNAELEKDINNLIMNVRKTSQTITEDDLDSFLDKITKITENIKKKRKTLKTNKQMIENNNINSKLKFKVVDASFDFRALKLKRLQDVEQDVEVDEVEVDEVEVDEVEVDEVED